MWWISFIAILTFFIYYERILFTEEEFLRKKFGESYLHWASKTPVFFPKFKNWRQPSLKFSARAVLGREYSSFFAIIASFTFLELMGDLVTESHVDLNVGWIVLFSTGLIAYIILRILKKRTEVLRTTER